MCDRHLRVANIVITNEVQGRSPKRNDIQWKGAVIEKKQNINENCGPAGERTGCDRKGFYVP